MARRRRTNLGDEMLDSLAQLFGVIHPAWSIPLAALFFFGSVAAFHLAGVQPHLRVLAYLVGGLPAVTSLAAGVIGWVRHRERNRFFAQNVDLDRIRKTTWKEFERRVADVYRHQGFDVDEVGGGGADGGVDLRIRRAGEKALVQCKRWNLYKVGVKPVRELFGVMKAEGADRAILISSGVYTEEARRFAEGKPIDLVDGVRLTRMLREIQESATEERGSGNLVGLHGLPASLPTTPTSVAPKCPQCGMSMVERLARHGSNAGSRFWGCPGFPNCRGTRSA